MTRPQTRQIRWWWLSPTRSSNRAGDPAGWMRLSETRGDQDVEGVVDRLERDGPEFGPDDFGRLVGRDVGPTGNGPHDGQSLGRDPNAALTKEVCRSCAHADAEDIKLWNDSRILTVRNTGHGRSPEGAATSPWLRDGPPSGLAESGLARHARGDRRGPTRPRCHRPTDLLHEPRSLGYPGPLPVARVPHADGRRQRATATGV